MDIWRQATENWSELCAAMGCTRMQVPGAIVQSYPIERSGPFYNSAFVQKPQSFEIEKVESIFAERRLPFVIVIPRLESYAELGKSLVEHGYSAAPAWCLMIQKELVGESNPKVRVDEIDRSGLNDWFALQDAFPHVQSSKAARLEMIERLSGNGSAQLLLASINHKPVGTGLLYLNEHVASIHMIATLNELRRRHVATTVTLEALRRARKEKVDLVWLRTRRGGIGEKVYAKIGFNVFSDILSYTKTLQYEDSNLPPK
jgi:ribosomal protein S18 acetylase RimI-like enzyme